MQYQIGKNGRFGTIPKPDILAKYNEELKTWIIELKDISDLDALIRRTRKKIEIHKSSFCGLEFSIVLWD